MHKKNLFNLRKSIIALVFGFFTTFLVATILDTSSFGTLINAVFIKPFSTQHILELCKLISIYIIVALAVTVSFKAELFNIGVPGQMLAGALIPSMLVATIARDFSSPFTPVIFILMGIMAGAIVGGLSGYLKARFNVHEVIGTIMLNWIIFYIGKGIFSQRIFKSIGGLGSKVWMPYHQVNAITTIIIALILIFIIWYIFSKTKLGYKITLVGKQSSVSDYAGYSTEKIQTLTMAISGGLAGLAGVLFYGSYITQYFIPLFDGFDSIGFNAIVVALVAFINPLIVAPIAIIFATVHFGGFIASINFKWATELIALAFGLMMYMIAITENWKYKHKKNKRDNK